MALPLLSGCVLTADSLDPALDVPERYRAAAGRDSHAPPPQLRWWQAFGSRELSDLMEQARTANLDIAAAIARVVQADAQARITGAALLPSLTGTGAFTRSRPSDSTGTNAIAVTDRTNYNLALSASFVLDFWGHNRALLRAAEDGAAASRFDREVIELTALVSTANAYFVVLEAQERVRIARENVTAAERILNLIQERFNNGTATALDVAQQASVVAIQRASIPPLIQQIEQTRAAIALLVGRAPEHIEVHGGGLFSLRLPRVTPGLPSELLSQRPDIREAEAKLAGADANVEAARAAFFPTIQLTGVGGGSSARLHRLFLLGSGFYSLAPNVTLPIFDGGNLRGQLDMQKGLREELLQDYRKAVISAFADVERALVAIQQLARQERLQRDAVAQSRQAFTLSEERLRAGTIDLTTLLTAEQTLFQQEDTLAVVRFNRLQAMTALYQALGGGWLAAGDRRSVASIVRQ